MPNSSVNEDYLKAIFYLGRDGSRVQTTALARQLGVSKPSVTSMLKRLAGKGLVDYSSGQGATLTEEGRLATMRVVRRHRLLETFLVEVLHLDWSEVHAEAEVLEHHLSARMVDAIDRLLGHPSEDPHGHPIPDAQGRLRTRELVPLGDLAAGERGTVREVRTAQSGRLQRWKELGLVPGAAVAMRSKQDLEDVMHVRVGDRELATGTEGVDGVFVEREE
ncbi:MAG: metal-dependent transcriptional regulator [Planctomycetes bacterium]|nr:metal-dependent transcriptional regulator [Planctomycetota bacterium]